MRVSFLLQSNGCTTTAVIFTKLPSMQEPLKYIFHIPNTDENIFRSENVYDGKGN